MNSYWACSLRTKDEILGDINRAEIDPAFVEGWKRQGLREPKAGDILPFSRLMIVEEPATEPLLYYHGLDGSRKGFWLPATGTMRKIQEDQHSEVLLSAIFKLADIVG